MIDSSVKCSYSEFILLNYNDFDIELVKYVATNCNYNHCVEIIENFINNSYGTIDKTIELIEFNIQNRNMFKELLDLLILYPDNAKLIDFCNKVANSKYKFINWEELLNPLLKMQIINEEYLITKIFIPMSKEYLKENKYYIDEKYYEIFDELFIKSTQSMCIEELNKLARLGIQYGLLKFTKYLKTPVSV